STEHNLWNAYRIVSSFNCTVDNCSDVHGSQSVDVTYDTDTDSTPSLYSTIKNCRIHGSQDTAVTSHAGSYGVVIANNVFTNCRYGPLIRSRECVIDGNYISGTGIAYSIYGIRVTEGYAINSVIANNYIEDFSLGIDMHPYSSIDNLGLLPMNMRINNNRFVRCQR